jgi:hypothetical protein
MADDDVIGAPGRGTHRAAAAFIFVTILLDMLATGIVIPILPKLVESLPVTTPRRPRAFLACSAPSGR